MNNNQNVKLNSFIKDIAAGPFGSNLKVECFVQSGFPIIDGANLKGVKVTDNVTKFVTEEKARSLSRSIAQRGDVIVTISGNVGQISYIPKDSKYSEYLVSQRQFRVTFDENEINVPYLVYYFHTREGSNKILSFANQTGVPALAQPLKNFRNIEVNLPPLPTQQRIASILSSLDAKIENNNKINAKLEEIAQNLFKEWFVDFGPFKNGKFVESELGLIPEGWRVGTLGEICAYSKRKISTQSLNESNYFSTENMLPNKAGVTIASSIPEVDMVTGCMEYDVLVSNIRPYFKKIFRVNGVAGCSADVLCFHPNGSKFYSYLYCILYEDNFFAYVMSGAKGTKMPRGDKSQIMKYPILLPEESILGNFSNIVEPIFERIKTMKEENQRLATLRDTLLPKLMSGEIEV